MFIAPDSTSSRNIDRNGCTIPDVFQQELMLPDGIGNLIEREIRREYAIFLKSLLVLQNSLDKRRLESATISASCPPGSVLRPRPRWFLHDRFSEVVRAFGGSYWFSSS